jgi:hypothetical protein
VRPPAVAGQFYEGSKSSLLKQINWCYMHPQGPKALPKVKKGPRNLVGLVSPHAGYMYSGPVAAHGFAFMASDGKPEHLIILGPNHTGVGSGVSIMTSGKWSTPLGEARIDAELGEAIAKSSEIIDVDSDAHAHEHSIEVQLPFLQHLFGEINFVPICMMLQDQRTSDEVGDAISKASAGKDVAIVASTDLTHYESQRSAVEKDNKALDAITALDGAGLIATVEREGITMCGYGPVAAMIRSAKKLGAKRAKVLKHATSGDIAPPMSQVVGYGSVAVLR